MLQRLEEGLNPGDSTKLFLMVALKAISLGLYAFLVHLVLIKNKMGLSKKPEPGKKTSILYM